MYNIILPPVAVVCDSYNFAAKCDLFGYINFLHLAE